MYGYRSGFAVSLLVSADPHNLKVLHLGVALRVFRRFILVFWDTPTPGENWLCVPPYYILFLHSFLPVYHCVLLCAPMRWQGRVDLGSRCLFGARQSNKRWLGGLPADMKRSQQCRGVSCVLILFGFQMCCRGYGRGRDLTLLLYFFLVLFEIVS